ncbi:hypothetical protein NE619_18015 [Anaerovorax odorimutans]|uniref:Uncharacterized protein n=1 Tax=Anaerovorax odorimutans TaxID=109327 RepID=A0ABT1RTU5_9FIRM|nr:hypothetical protein [Anaerovorax odorimutans]MCQ4638628.1 hypothetical protein [Anaerovorax odorimutans]
MKKEIAAIEFDKYECGAVFEALKDKRNALIQEELPTDTVDDALIKVIDAMNEPKRKERNRDEAR